jgi:ubiquinone/menaquinone biosynthesis C-methylase UbiE
MEYRGAAMSLDTYIASLHALSKADDPQQALEECRRVMTEKVESAVTQSEKEQAYLYYKAFYELQPWPKPGAGFCSNSKAENMRATGASLMLEPDCKGPMRGWKRNNK